MNKMNIEEENEKIEDMTTTEYIQNEKGELVIVADVLKDVFTFYKDELPAITYYAVGKQQKVYYNLGMGLCDYCKEISYEEFLEAEKSSRKEVDAHDINGVFLTALYNQYKKDQNPPQ